MFPLLFASAVTNHNVVFRRKHMFFTLIRGNAHPSSDQSDQLTTEDIICMKPSRNKTLQSLSACFSVGVFLRLFSYLELLLIKFYSVTCALVFSLLALGCYAISFCFVIPAGKYAMHIKTLHWL